MTTTFLMDQNTDLVHNGCIWLCLHQELTRKNSFRETRSYKASQLFNFNTQTTY